MNKKELLLKKLYKNLQFETFMLAELQKSLARNPTRKMHFFISDSIVFTQSQIKVLLEVISRLRNESQKSSTNKSFENEISI